MENYMIKDLNKWLPWFVGFSDAEGSFQVYAKKRVLKSGYLSKVNVGYSYHLSLHKKDIDILKNIQYMINSVGSIYEYKHKLDSRLAIYNKSGLFDIINKIFDIWPLITKHQSIRYNLLKKGLFSDVKEFSYMEQYNTFMYNSTDEINTELNPNLKNDRVNKLMNIPYIDNWIIGFINGEGSFPINKGRCIFTIEHTDVYALNLIKERLSFGPKVYERSPIKRDIGKIRKTTYLLEVSSKNDIGNFIYYLDDNKTANLQGNKSIQYNKWKNTYNKQS